MDTNIIIAVVIILAVFYFGVISVKVNDEDLKEKIPAVRVDVKACEVCARQCGFNYTGGRL